MRYATKLILFAGLVIDAKYTRDRLIQIPDSITSIRITDSLNFLNVNSNIINTIAADSKLTSKKSLGVTLLSS